jgi:hypothetical protein
MPSGQAGAALCEWGRAGRDPLVTAPQLWRLGYADYPRFRAVVVAEMGSEREYDLLTAPRQHQGERNGTSSRSGTKLDGHRNNAALRAIRRAPERVRALYRDGLISQALRVQARILRHRGRHRRSGGRPAGGSRYRAPGASGDRAGAVARDAVECRIPAAISSFCAAIFSAKMTLDELAGIQLTRKPTVK